MEKVAFLIPETGQRLGCLLNPDTLVVQRRAGVHRRESVHGLLTGAGQSDDPLLHTGGGVTEMTLDLLFDISLAGSTIASDDVRDLTRPLWSMAENPADGGHPRQPPVVVFIWGRAWNFRGVVSAAAERLERFAPSGAPSRSWLRLRLLRCAEERSGTAAPAFGPPSAIPGPGVGEAVPGGLPPAAAAGPSGPPPSSARPDQLAHSLGLPPERWREVAGDSGYLEALLGALGLPGTAPSGSAAE